ncbi:NAD-dependent succinate-semialdehyde dehydrogenase [Homoserinibacter sp. GY 40078]|uniref:NAD-dependent succinate-semialdehyde dehydrogenase n=1 Tax=Homoserinibacter sp. GY 40078 TaxID=2603275 RepID=UPI0011CC083F|nr:NAD-dependent succinate-semialdehyde dehydrogenase [Homoserinibacter sp. GY 40078]TXK19256.1 NAD-dependent succinate-semialdehyde dehydrogenase [Homoserinibacter sp. GY 40078]
MRTYDLLIDGRWSAPSDGEFIEVVNPSTGEVCARTARATADDLDRALDSAAGGWERWRSRSGWERSSVLRAAASLLAARADAVAETITREQGKPLREARLEVALAIEQLDWCADEARRIYGRTMEAPSPSIRYRVERAPVGPVAAFTPWNFPISLAARKIGPALAAGCSIIVKPAEEAPGAAIALAECLVEAGVDEGALVIVTGDPVQISDHLVSSPIIRKVSLTGSVPVGRRVMELAARNISAVSMELGGHAPVVVFGDVDPVEVARACVTGKFRNAGQVCISPTRFYVQDEIAAEFSAAFVEATAALRVGDGMDESTHVGPLASGRRRDAVHSVVEQAARAGASLVLGGRPIDGPGFYYEPTVLTGLADDAALMQEEPFGPVVPIASFSTFDDVIAKANSTRYGLAAYVFTRDLGLATRAAEQIEAGLVGINTFAVSATPVPFSGVKLSGIGAENGAEAIEGYLVTKSIVTSVGEP